MEERALSGVQTSGGRGSRSRPLSLYSIAAIVPKGLMRVMGLPIAEIQLEQFRRDGINTVYVVTQYLENREFLANRFSDGHHRFGLNLKYSDPADDNLNNGSGDAILTNIEKEDITGDSVCLANDNLYEFDSRRAVQVHRDSGAVISILTTRLTPRETIRTYGLVDVDHTHKVLRLLEKPEDEKRIMEELNVTDPTQLGSMRVHVNTGGYILNNYVLADLVNEEWIKEGRKDQRKEFDMAGVFIKGIIERGYPVYIIPTDAWGDLGSVSYFLDTMPDALQGKFSSISRILQTRVFPDGNSQYYHDAERNVWIHFDTLTKKDLEGRTLEQRIKVGNVAIGPHVFVGRSSTIEDGAEIRYSDLEKDSKIGKGAKLDHVYLSPYCEIGSFAQLEESALGYQVRVRSSQLNPVYIGGRSVIGPSILVPEGTKLENATIFPGYGFDKPATVHRNVVLRPDLQQIMDVLGQYM